MSNLLALTRPRAASVTLVVLIGALLAWAPAASAGKGVVASFGQLGDGAGEFAFPAGVAVNQATGDVYVADVDCCSFDTGGQRVMQFDASGSFVRGWGWGVATGAEQFEICTTTCSRAIQGSGDGQFSMGLDPVPPQLAIDQSDGAVYVVDTLNNRVQKFSASGAFIDAFGSTVTGGELSGPSGVAVDPASGDVYVADANNNRIVRFDTTGAYQSEIGTPGGGSGDGELLSPTRLAVDSSGRLYVIDAGNGRVQRFSDSGAFEQVFAAGAVTAPTEVAVDPADDHVYLAGQNADLTVRAIFEFDPAGNGVDSHAANIGSEFDRFPAGLAVRSATGRLYGGTATLALSAVLVIDEVTPPSVAIDPVSDVTDTSATFSGIVDPQGPPDTRYRFEYSTDGSSWTSTPEIGVSAAGPNSVSRAVTGLQPNTGYSVRLVAVKDYNAAESTSTEEVFTTDPGRPFVSALGAGNRTDAEAWLGAEVNPRNSQTAYYVEYTLASDAAYASSSRVPAAPATVDIGAGNAYVAVSQLASGLQPDTEYRFRVVAMNVAGTTAGASRMFRTRATLPAPPAGRAYEMVSPLDKNGATIGRDVVTGIRSTYGAAASGDAMAYPAYGQFAGVEGASPQSQYRSVRSGSGGWRTRGISPPMEQYLPAEGSFSYAWYLSEDLTRAVVSTNAQLVPSSGLLGGSFGLYLQDNSAMPLSYELLSRPADQLAPDDEPNLAANRFVFADASSDMRHVVFNSTGRKLTADDPDFEWGVYQWSDGEVRFISRSPSGEPFDQALAGERTNFQAMEDYPGDHVVSDDGRRVFFKDGFARLYAREDGIVTRPVSASERASDPEGAQPATFWAAEATSGAKALFSSAKSLTDDSPDVESAEEIQSLYIWNADAPEGSRLTNLTTSDPAGARVIGVAGAADDMSRVYFVAAGSLADGAAAGQPNLYIWSATDGVRHVAVLSANDAPVWSRNRNISSREARLSDDGSRLLFASRADVTATDTGGRVQLYLYDALTDRLDCVSCGNGPVAGDAWLSKLPDSSTEGNQVPYRLPRNLSSDGRRVFFETAESLVAGDTNGRSDVYMWSDGDLSLISSGRGAQGSQFLDASESGDDVFFTTDERLVGSDTDDLVDVYDARVGGGFPEQMVPDECVGDGCQGPATGSPGASPIASRDLRGRGDVMTGARASLSLAAITHAQRARLARGERVLLRLRVSRAGQVRVVARARIAGRNTVVASASRRARRAGTLRVALRLSRLARRQLVAGGRLRLRLSARLSGMDESRRLRLSLGRSR